MGFKEAWAEKQKILNKQKEESLRKKKILEMRLDEIEMSIRASNGLRLANIHTIGNLIKISERYMMKYKNVGPAVIMELKKILEKFNLKFKASVSEITELKRKIQSLEYKIMRLEKENFVLKHH